VEFTMKAFWRVLLGSVVALGALSTTETVTSGQDLDGNYKTRLAEKIAFIRHAPDFCIDTLRVSWAIDVITLYIEAGEAAPTADEIEGKEDEIMKLQRRIGQSMWCRLYAVEMKEAHLTLQMRDNMMRGALGSEWARIQGSGWPDARHAP
jgi:hypothetical protein